jgi:hypothetical protein
MCCQPLKPEPAVHTEPPSTTERLKEYTRQKRQQFLDSYQPPTPTVPNSETHLELGPVPPARESIGLDVNHYHIADEVWHWSSTDYGKKCMLNDDYTNPADMRLLTSASSLPRV